LVSDLPAAHSGSLTFRTMVRRSYQSADA